MTLRLGSTLGGNGSLSGVSGSVKLKLSDFMKSELPVASTMEIERRDRCVAKNREATDGDR